MSRLGRSLIVVERRWLRFKSANCKGDDIIAYLIIEILIIEETISISTKYQLVLKIVLRVSTQIFLIRY